VCLSTQNRFVLDREQNSKLTSRKLKFQFLVFCTTISSDVVTLASVREFGNTGHEDGVLHNGTGFVMLLLMLSRSLDFNTMCVNV